MSAINPRSPVPKYHQLRDILLDFIELEGTVNAPIPSERELSDRHGLSRMTVRQAVDSLVAEGRLYRVAGRGTFVSRPKMELQVRLASFTEDMRTRGMQSGSTTIALERVVATPHLARELEITVGETVVRIERLRFADDIPMALEVVYLPERVVPTLQQSDLAGTSLYLLLAEKYGVVLTWGEQSIEAGSADATTAGLLQISTGGVVLRMRRHSYSDDVRVEYAQSMYRADRYKLWVPLTKPALPYRRTVGTPTDNSRSSGGNP
ncbi:MAG: GntR family transcriptional regulator, N-acetylglucosamine utilization regulator [Frankiaceae bacterium]|jgi:GntR family transcriptional regulator|nr:GntR family transcriptional regulator, N-acetylglucosamine utilization regulator [Frankiaceae bacterium]MDQ1723157.1 GntR family transcriptional regulator, N-acetylglucosamine utilization regulator [Frankiaceae bacterium]